MISMMMKFLISIFTVTILLSCASSVKPVTPVKNDEKSFESPEKISNTFFSKPFLKNRESNKPFSLKKIADGKILFIDFSIENCVPCRKLDIYIKKMSERYGDRVKFIKIVSNETVSNDNEFYMTVFPKKEEWQTDEYPSVIIYSADGEENISLQGLYPILYYMSAIEEIL